MRLSGAGGGNDKMRRAAENLLRLPGVRLPLLACVGMLTLLSACGQENKFVAPPPPKVTVQLPLQQMVTPYLEATGNAASPNNIKLVARVEGYVQEIKYKDGEGGQEGHAAVRDPAAALPGRSAAGAGRGGGGQGGADQCPGRIHPAARTPVQGRVDTGQPRQGARRPRHVPSQRAAGAGEHAERGDQLQLYDSVGPVRRGGHRAQGLARRTGRRQSYE